MLTFDPRDLWIGIYWDRKRFIYRPTSKTITTTDVYVCVVPCFPIHLSWTR